MLPFDIATGKVERYSSEGGPHFEAAEACACRGCFTDLKNSAADSPARPGRMYEKSPYLRRFVVRIEESILAAGAMVTAIERPALAPAAASGCDFVLIHLGLGDKIGAIVNQLRIDPKNAFQSQLELLRGIVRRLQAENGGAYEPL